ncbi:MAG TPA: hypothetical protein VF612_03930 [Jatrophihabitans sp.]|uniref:hypothetical protein n=1 Tax=Jatrophihabitans sp. TaxID=1932789 RepID=UPI002F0F0508
MQVVVLLLLVAGLALLVLGLITGSTPLVVASIAASLLAGMAILRYRRQQESGDAGASSRGTRDGAAGQARDGAQVRTPARVPVLATVAGEPARGSAAGAAVSVPPVAASPVAVPPVAASPVAVPPAHAAAPAPAAEPANSAEPKHLAHAEDLAGRGDPAGPGGPDEFDHPAGPGEPVESDDPADPEPAEADTDPPLRSRGDEPVWVIDGRPRYHLPGCAFLIGREPEPEPVPLRQAVEDGFTPCALCDPDTGLAAG